MVLCFKLYFIKDATICTTAAATVRQMVSVIFERVVTEDSQGLGKKFHPTFGQHPVRFVYLGCSHPCDISWRTLKWLLFNLVCQSTRTLSNVIKFHVCLHMTLDMTITLTCCMMLS